MSNYYEEAKRIAEKLVELEITRKTACDEMKRLKEELLGMCESGTIETTFEVQNGLVYMDTKTTHKPADGLKEETMIKSKSPEKLSQDFIDFNFVPDLKLSKMAKKAISEGDSELLSVLSVETKHLIKIVTK